MDVQNTTGATATAGAAKTAAADKSLNYDAFLQLLIAQMRNQDPTEPVDPTTQMAQLATFSQVEQGIKTNAKLDAMLTSSALSQADGVIGRTITSVDGFTSGEAVALTVGAEGAIAILEDGTELPLGAGVKIS
jgi:flagellar basal-body rod modification protein FlgD